MHGGGDTCGRPSTVQAQPTSSVDWGSVLVASPPIIISPVGNGTTSSGSTPGAAR